MAACFDRWEGYAKDMYVEIRSLTMKSSDKKLRRTRLGKIELVNGDLVFDGGVKQFENLRPREDYRAQPIDPDESPDAWLRALPRYLTNGYIEAELFE